MSKTSLRFANQWTPIRKQDARALGLSVEPLAPILRPENIGLVLDHSQWVEMPVAGPWMVAFRVADQRGQPIISEVRLFPFEKDTTRKPPAGQWSGVYGASVRVPPAGITARLLREVRTRAFRAALREIVARHRETLAALDFPAARPVPASHRGRKGRTDTELAHIAAAYEVAYLAARPAIAAVAKRFRLSPSKARDAVHRARVRGLLSPASKQGIGGGLLTPLAQKILKQDAKSKGGKRHGKKR